MIRITVLLALAVASGGCAEAEASVHDATAEAFRNTRDAGIAVSAPAHLAARTSLGRCRPGRASGWVFNPAAVSSFGLRTALGEAQAKAVAVASDASLVSVELRCRAGEGEVLLDAAFYSPARKRLWWANQTSDARVTHSPSTISSARVEQEVRRRAGRYVGYLLINK